MGNKDKQIRHTRKKYIYRKKNKEKEYIYMKKI